jgi:hypothetical protein
MRDLSKFVEDALHWRLMKFNMTRRPLGTDAKRA